MATPQFFVFPAETYYIRPLLTALDFTVRELFRVVTPAPWKLAGTEGEFFEVPPCEIWKQQALPWERFSPPVTVIEVFQGYYRTLSIVYLFQEVRWERVTWGYGRN